MVKSIFTQFRADTFYELPVLLFDAKPIVNVALKVLGEFIGPILDSSVNRTSRENTLKTREEHSKRSHDLSIKLDHLRRILLNFQIEQDSMVSQRNILHSIYS